MSEHGESTRQAAKRAKQQTLGTFAAIRQVGNEGIQLSGGASNSPSTMRVINDTQELNASNSTGPTSKNTRGKSKMSFWVKGKGRGTPLSVEFNERGQPIGENANKFSSCLGDTAREVVPVTLNDWKDLSDDFRKQIWEHIQQKFIVDDSHKKYAFQKMNKHWSNHRATLIRNVLDQAKVIGQPRAITLLKPENVHSMEEWQTFFKKRVTAEYLEKCKQFKKMRESQKLLHTTSRMGYARLEDKMRRESENPDLVSRVDVWVKGHQRKNGEYKTEEIKRTVENIQQHCGEAPSSSLNEDAITKVLGPERRGRVRGLGFGATPSKLDSQKHSRDKVSKLEAAVANMQSQLDEMKNWCQQMITKNQNETSGVQCSNNHETTQIQRQGENIEQNGQSCPKEGTKCKLLDWRSEGEKIVAMAEISSTNPSTLVHHVQLGRGNWKVWVIEVLEDEVPLFRPTREFFQLEDAMSSTIAWPIKDIKID